MSSDPHGPSVTDPRLTRWRSCSHPHAHHMLACSSTGKDELSRCWRWSDTHTRTTLSLSSPLLRAYTRFLLASLLPPWLSLALFLTSFSSEWTSNSFYICGPSRRPRVRPKLTPPHLRMVTMTTRALQKKAGVRDRERTLLRKNKGSRKKCV